MTMLTSKDVQDLIKVDRSTIYRMAEDGRIPAVKVGRQWRFPADLIHAWLNGATPGSTTAGPPSGSLATLLLPGVAKPLADLLSGIFGVMVLVTDLDGQPLIEPSNPCGLFSFVHDAPGARTLCATTWRELGEDPNRLPRFQPTPLGFECARGFIRVGTEVKGLVIMGGVAPAEWPPDNTEIGVMAGRLKVPTEDLAGHIDEVFYLDRSHQAWVLEHLPRISSLFSRIARERALLVDRLDEIATIAEQNTKTARSTQ